MSLLPFLVALWSALGDDAPPPALPAPWVAAEKENLVDHVPLTDASRFTKAGECYFSPDARRIIFQAVERDDDPAREEGFYQMYVADLVYEGGRLVGAKNYKRLSPPGSSNTCGWFHPTEENVVIFGSTIVPPKNPEKTGYQRATKKYSWQFPAEMDIVRCNITSADGTAESLERLIGDPNAYLAECVIRDDGRYLVFCERVVDEGASGGDLIILDLENGRSVPVTGKAGYDGGPFFSPEGRRICYRSDRRGDDLLQVFVAELAFDYAGNVLGVDREFQLTDNVHVNWAPFWHPNGRYLVYTTSEIGHENYEVFVIDADAGADDAPTRYGTRKRRVTYADGFDGLPVFNHDASLMMWTSQRSQDKSSQVWAARFVMPLDRDPAQAPPPEPQGDRPERIQAADPSTGLIYLYDPSTHELTVYDPQTHAVRAVSEAEEIAKAMQLFRERDGK